MIPSYKNSIPSSQLAAITTEMNDRTYSRILETFQFVLDVMACTKPLATPPLKGNSPEKYTGALDPGGEGWKAAIRVRLLHGVARRRIFDRLHSSPTTYSVDDDGVPINQEDMSATCVTEVQRCTHPNSYAVADWALSAQLLFGV